MRYFMYTAIIISIFIITSNIIKDIIMIIIIMLKKTNYMNIFDNTSNVDNSKEK